MLFIFYSRKKKPHSFFKKMDHDLKACLLMATIIFFIWLAWRYLNSESESEKTKGKPITDDDYDF